jgi:hypothetical protein
MMTSEPEFAKLTHRQREVLNLLTRQLSNNELARFLQLAQVTMAASFEAATKLTELGPVFRDFDARFRTAPEAVGAPEGKVPEAVEA